MLTKEERKERASAKRKELSDGRNNPLDGSSQAAGRADEGGSGNFGIADATAGPAFQDVGKSGKRFTPTGNAPKSVNRRDRDDKRSVTRQPERERRSTGRDEKSSGGGPVDSANAESSSKPEREQPEQPGANIGRFYAGEVLDEPEPFKLDTTPDPTFAMPVPELSRFKEDYRRTTRDGANVYAMIDYPEAFITADEYKLLTNRGAVEPEKPKTRTAKVLTQQEADDLREPLQTALPQCGEYLDKFFWKVYPHLDERPIWSNLQPYESKAIAKILLKRAQVDPTTAAVVRMVVDGSDYATALVALGSRGYETYKAHRERPRVARKSKFSIIRMPEAVNNAD